MTESADRPDETGQTRRSLNIDLNLKLYRAINVCPANGQKGKLVPNQTVKAFLKVSLRSVSESEYFFCADQDCPVVYFSADGTQTFEVDQLREAVYQKEISNSAVLVCYCFQYSLDTIQTASHQQRQVIVSDIKQGTAAGQCACDIRNPQGSCCLGNVTKLIKQLEA